jgi:hypothetical protein
MRRMVIVGTVLMLAAYAAGSTDSTPPVEVTWSGEVLPALESAICIQVTEFKGLTLYAPMFGQCPEPAGLSPAMRAVRQVLVDRAQVLRTLYSAAAIQGASWKAVPKGTPSYREALLARFRADLLASPRIQVLVMPAVFACLSASGVTCADCPGPRTQPPVRSVTLAALMPYAVAFYWPDSIRPDGSLQLHVCVGTNGLARIREVDLELADATVAAMFANIPAVMAAGRAITVEVAKSPQYAGATNADTKLELLRSTLAARLPADHAFESALATGAAKALPGLGLQCSDCAALSARATEAPPPLR